MTCLCDICRIQSTGKLRVKRRAPIDTSGFIDLGAKNVVWADSGDAFVSQAGWQRNPVAPRKGR